MNEDMLRKLVDEYYVSRPNLELSNEPLCVFFFACSGSGKSTTRRLLVDELKATYVCNDEVRELLAQHPEAIERGVELKEVVANTVERIFAESPNKLIVFDNNIIQYYMHDDSYLNVARRNGRPVFIIGLETPEEQLRERIKERGVNVEQTLSELPGQLEDYKKATRDIQPNWYLSSSNQTTDLAESIRNFLPK